MTPKVKFTPGGEITRTIARTIVTFGKVEICDPTGRMRECLGDQFPQTLRAEIVKQLALEFGMTASDVLDAVFDLPRFYPRFRLRKGSVFVDMRAGMVDARKTIPDFKSGAYFRRFVR